MNQPLLIVGEVILDLVLARPGSPSKIHLGGILHAARGLGAHDVPFAAAAVCPSYLLDTAETELQRLGCVNFIHLGEVLGAPNVMTIGDPTEVAAQGYEFLLRLEKSVRLNDVRTDLKGFNEAIVFPGTYDLAATCSMLAPECRLHIDVAYDIDDIETLSELGRQIDTILISTSSDLFHALAGTTETSRLWDAFKSLGPSSIVLKENRGGSRVMIPSEDRIELVPALLGSTHNSVGVGDVFSATYVALKFTNGAIAAAWRATQSSSAYAQTSDVELFQRYVQRGCKLTVDQLADLGGISLPWERRQQFPIYLAGPDFSHGDRRAFDQALASLQYHNFHVRRPVVENGELPPNSSPSKLRETFEKDVALLAQASLVFAVPTGRDPGTLVEIGIAIERSIPVVVYDAAAECNNTMVIAGARCYSDSLDVCLSAVFSELSAVWEAVHE